MVLIRAIGHHPYDHLRLISKKSSVLPIIQLAVEHRCPPHPQRNPTTDIIRQRSPSAAAFRRPFKGTSAHRLHLQEPVRTLTGGFPLRHLHATAYLRPFRWNFTNSSAGYYRDGVSTPQNPKIMKRRKAPVRSLIEWPFSPFRGAPKETGSLRGEGAYQGYRTV